ncbi:MAG: cytochrome c biogenesis CcdA family protein [Acidimicrobiales bacterium]
MLPATGPATVAIDPMIVTGAIRADPLGLLVAFGAGMLSFLSPCVLPMVPGYLSMVSGLSAAELGSLHLRHERPYASTGDRERMIRSKRSRLIRGIILFIAGFTVVFTVLGASASAAGHLLRAHLPQLTALSGVLIVVFGAILVAVASGIRIPAVFATEHRIAVRPSLLGAWAPPIMGAAFAFAWTPCIGPILASVLALAAGTGGTATGGVALLLAYSLGLGVPFLLFGLACGRMTDLLARFRGRLRLVDLFGGAVLIVFGVLLITGNVNVISGDIAVWLRDLHLGRLATS